MKRPDEAIRMAEGFASGAVRSLHCEEVSDVLAYLAHVEAVSALRGAECRASRAWENNSWEGDNLRGDLAVARAATDAAGALDE